MSKGGYSPGCHVVFFHQVVCSKRLSKGWVTGTLGFPNYVRPCLCSQNCFSFVHNFDDHSCLYNFRIVRQFYFILNLTSFHSGTTWVQEIVWQILNEGQIASDFILDRVPFLEAATSARFPQPNYTTLQSPRIVKTHLTYNIIPKSANEDSKCKYIYIARNPKDVAVSFFEFTTSMKVFGHGFNGPWEFFAKLFVEGNGKFVIKLTEPYESRIPDAAP